MNALMVYSGHPADFQDYLSKLNTEAVKAGVPTFDFRLVQPVELYFNKESYGVFLANTPQYDRIGAKVSRKWNKWRPLIVLACRIFSFALRPLGFRYPEETFSSESKKGFHCLVLGIKEDIVNETTGGEQR